MRDSADANDCQGAWEKVGRDTYVLNHYALPWNLKHPKRVHGRKPVAYRQSGTNNASHRGRQLKVKVTSNAAGASAITHTSTAMDTWSVRRHSAKDASSAALPSPRSHHRAPGVSGRVRRSCRQCASFASANQAMPRKLLSNAASSSHASPTTARHAVRAAECVYPA